MSDKELYEIEYTLLGEHHVDVIENLDVPIIEVVHELALKHHVELDDLSAGDAGMPHAAGITTCRFIAWRAVKAARLLNVLLTAAESSSVLRGRLRTGSALRL